MPKNLENMRRAVRTIVGGETVWEK